MLCAALHQHARQQADWLMRLAISCTPNSEHDHVERVAAFQQGAMGHVGNGTLCAVMGPSGCGKSTLLEILAGRKAIGHIGGEVGVDKACYAATKSGWCEAVREGLAPCGLMGCVHRDGVAGEEGEQGRASAVGDEQGEGDRGIREDGAEWYERSYQVNNRACDSPVHTSAAATAGGTSHGSPSPAPSLAHTSRNSSTLPATNIGTCTPTAAATATGSANRAASAAGVEGRWGNQEWRPAGSNRHRTAMASASALVPQEDSFPPVLSAREVLELWAKLRLGEGGRTGQQIREEAVERGLSAMGLTGAQHTLVRCCQAHVLVDWLWQP